MERRDNSHEEDAEDVSLCDLPVLSLLKKDQEEKRTQRPDDDGGGGGNNDNEEAKNNVLFEAHEEFAFGSVTGGSLSTAAEMCAADEVFFRGQILPLRLSVSSDAYTTRLDPARDSRSESMDRGSVVGFRSISSRSSSCSSRSTQNSSSVTSGTFITITRIASEPRLRTRNQFGSHPSPKPQIRVSSARGLERVSSAGRKQKSSMWDFFRLGLVRTPDIELQEIKANLRGNSGNKCTNYSVTRSSSVNNNNNNNNYSTSCGENSNNIAEKQKRRNFLSGCKCSAEAVAFNAIVAKSKGNCVATTNGDVNDGINGTTKHVSGTKEKAELKSNGDVTTSSKMKSVRQSDRDHDQNKRQEGSSRKQAVSHHRTYEWLKQLSHANPPMHV
ncbi:hypothetical protein L484_009423 [Morus notabilis]|uniref:Uncharacterized protein n=2 Tax=Morus notabilis TaxID=981085 RepID=W9QJZ4_9ROSA|nr:hypothetical protein L484_009423 [Morus notabilis]